MQTTLQLIKASEDMLEQVNEIYLNCRDHLLENGVLQWDDHYPNKEYFQECIEDQVLLVLLEKEKMIGHVVLNDWQSEEWAPIPWTGSRPLVIHSLMINPQVQDKGLGTNFVKLCEHFAVEQGYKSIRLDAFSGNAKATHLYEKLGYQKRGSVFFDSKPEGHQEYICFEKVL
ncbi:GNAT family N-acetyltransferase [Neobacillus niacini]|uniref:GNAT family N-acetyltransferase n=1 Tax=Neobacillus niacini TaxID=86668 RepID=UPI0021CB38AB|nr:GNAT family N-acetyltransferase [Neobacillus niacini]MCM3764473.1 GNAT family N-acetyltransferase [Neobacillus niacini]